MRLNSKKSGVNLVIVFFILELVRKYLIFVWLLRVVLILCYQYMYDRMYEQTVMLLGTAGRLVSHIMLRLMQLTKRRLYFLMTLTGETYKGSAQIPGVSLCGGTPA